MEHVLCDLISARRDEIVARARAMAARRPCQRSDSELYDGMPHFLDELSEALRLAPVRPPAPRGRDAQAHGARFWGPEFTVSQVVQSYGDICQAVTGLAVEFGTPIASDDFGAFNRLLDEAIANALVEYEAQREAAILRQGAERALSVALAFDQRLSIAIAASHALTMAGGSWNGSMGTLLDESLQGLQTLIAPLRG